ncbi:hypothetical protein U9R90_16190 [Streptomyces sp. E11-3]|uniref:hypothetical protein n=1 Tax=Streptomyces sp. E11-3 TaxID=3110112 RepID=UPI00397F5268
MFRRRRADELALIDADITAFGEELARHVFVPTGQDSDVHVLGDYERALEAYERAKRDFVGDRDREDAEDVMRALEEGRHALACAQARAAGKPLPARRPLCFFDPRHGPSTTEVRWTPPEGAPRLVDVCAAGAVRLKEGHAPIATGRTPVAMTRAPSAQAYRADPRAARGTPPCRERVRTGGRTRSGLPARPPPSARRRREAGRSSWCGRTPSGR